MAKARTEFELVGDEQALLRLNQISIAMQNLNRAHLAGQLTTEQHARATERLATAEKLLESRLQTTKTQMGVASQQLQRTTHDIRGARDAADLLSYQLGVPLPREMKKLIAQSTLIGPALSAAFKITAVVTAIGVVIKYREEIANAALAIGGLTQAHRELEAAAVAMSNKMLKRSELLQEIAKLEKQRAEVEPFTGPGTFLLNQGLWLAARLKLAEVDELLIKKKLEYDRRLDEENSKTKALTSTVVNHTVAIREQVKELTKLKQARLSDGGGWEGLFGPGTSGFEQALALQQQSEFAKAGMLTPGIIAPLEALKKEIPEVRDLHNQAFEAMAQDIDQFIQRVFLTARSFGDIWKQLWTQLLGHFVSVISRMIAAWVTGHQQMAAAGGAGGIAGAAGGGGGVGGFIRQLFGFGGGGASSSAGGGFSLSNGFSSSGALPLSRPGGFTDLSGLQSGVPMSAGGGVGAGSILATGATVSTTAKLGMGAQLAAMAPALALMGGLVGGAKLPGLLGFGNPTGAMIGAGVGATIGTFIFPGIGTIIGGLLGGLLGSLFGTSTRDKQKRKAMDILNQGRAQWKRIISDFESHRIDYGSAVAGVTQVWQQMVQAWSQPSLGKYGGIAIRNNEPEFRRTMQQLDDLQAKRQFTAQSPMFQAAGEFQTGGFVSPSLARPVGPLGIPAMPSGLRALPHFAGGGAVPAILHQREFVVNAPSTASVGRENMEYINRTGRLPAAAGGIELHIHAAAGMNEKQLAEFSVKALERELRDQGVNLRG